METLLFENRFHSFNVSYTEPPRFVALKLYDPHPLSMYHSPNNDNELLVPLKYYVIDDI